MKLATAITLCIALHTALAREVRIAWDAAPAAESVVGWRIYSGTTLISASSVPSATVNVPATGATLTVTAINAGGESPHSAPLVIPPAMVWIQRSTDLQTWQDVVQIPYAPSQFIRMEIPTP